MRAVRYDGQNVRLDTDSPEPTPGAGEAVVRVLLAAIDPIDLAVVAGDLPFRGVIGRKFVGEVVSVSGERGGELVGKRVVASPVVVDPTSEMARRGLGAHDPDRRLAGARGRDGALAERVCLPVTNLVPVPEGVTNEAAVFALPVARALHAARMVRLEGKAFITVLGDSVDALVSAQVMTRLNASVRVLGRREAPRRLCERWGVRHRDTDEAGRRHDQDVVIDCECRPDSVALALAMARPRGTVILKPDVAPVPGACVPALVGVNLSPALLHEIDIVSAHGGSVREGVALLASEPIDTDALLGRRHTLADAIGALRAAGDPDALTVLVEP